MMEHQVIAALVEAEQRTAGSQDPHRQRRLDALRRRERIFAARARAEGRMRMRAALARGIRRIAEAIEPPRPVCTAATPDPC
jgi:hypothetical protein